jgi:hypothetical protein
MTKRSALSGLIVLALAVASNPALAKDPPTVFVTKTGAKYHRDGCQYLRQSQIAIELDRAIAQGSTPCSRCRPPQGNPGSDAREPRRDPPARSAPSRASAQCAATTKKGTRCKRTASAGGSYCWQHQR